MSRRYAHRHQKRTLVDNPGEHRPAQGDVCPGRRSIADTASRRGTHAMHRRTFIGSCASGLVTIGTVVEGQPVSRIYRVGVLLGGTAEDAAPLLRALIEALRVLGLVDGRNLTFESRYAGVRLERLPELAAELVRLRVDVIVTGSNPFVAAAHRATLTIPIVFVAAADPVGAGFVASLAKPGGNITGLTTDASPELFAKNLGLLTEIVPNLTRVGVLRQADRAAGGLAELQAAARKLDVVVEVVDVRDLDELASAFSTMTGKRVGAVIVFGSLFYLRRQELADLALKHHLPAIHVLKGYAEAGLLMS